MIGVRVSKVLGRNRVVLVLDNANALEKIEYDLMFSQQDKI